MAVNVKRGRLSDGVGSNLDADKLDGISSEGFALADHNHDSDYAPLSAIIDTPTTITVGATGKDFTTIQAAWDSLKGKQISAAVTIACDPGEYNEALDLYGQPFGDLITIQGDTREAAGATIDLASDISKDGNNCTVTLNEEPPSDFTSSDHIILSGKFTSVNNAGRFPIVSIDVVNATVTYTNASGVAESVPNGHITFCPNRKITHENIPTPTVIVQGGEQTTVTGFTFIGALDNNKNPIWIKGNGTRLTIDKIVVYASNTGFTIESGACLAILTSNTYSYNVAAINCSIAGFHFKKNAGMQTGDTSVFAADCAIGILAEQSSVDAKYAEAIDCQIGFKADFGSNLDAVFSTTAYCTVAGFAAFNTSFINATGSDNSDNTADFDPATSGVEGNVSSIIIHS